MSFKTNEFQQLSINDCVAGLTAREQKALEKSWAKTFAEDIFPAIDEQRFSVLYSTKASRPNTPVNVIVGALIIKELFDLSDDEVVENLMLDPRYQYALHTTSFEEQPLSDKTLTRFRQRCYEYESATGIDLYGGCVKDLSAKIAKLMNVSGQIRRMDSMMVDANIRKLSRVELIYRCISKMLHHISGTGGSPVPEELQHYLDKDDFNKTFYHRRSSSTDDLTGQLLSDCDLLFDYCGSEYEGVTEYELLVRCLSEQTIVEDGLRKMRRKEDGGLDSRMLQSPTDPDATFRNKAGKKRSGYALNIEESVGENGSVITDFQFEQNIYGDSRFLRDRLKSMDVQEKPVTLIADGAYSGTDNTEAAAEKNVTLITTDLSGRRTSDIMADFIFSEDRKKVLSCPAGNTPKSCSFDKTNERYKVSFDRSCCENCPHKDECRAKIYKKVAKIVITKKSYARALSQKFRKSEEFHQLYRIRNGVETIPSILRRIYNIDRLPRGLQRGRFFTGSKIAALNFRKLLTMRRGRGHYAQNPVLT